MAHALDNLVSPLLRAQLHVDIARPASPQNRRCSFGGQRRAARQRDLIIQSRRYESVAPLLDRVGRIVIGEIKLEYPSRVDGYYTGRYECEEA